MIFLDGVGIGKKDFEYNPFFKYNFKTFKNIFGDTPSLENSTLFQNECFLFPTDANLGVDGLPQSGTGQASLFCGFNAPKYVGKHYGPYPYTTTIPILKEKNILVHFYKKHKSGFFANAYPKLFFDYLKSGRSRLSVTTLTCKIAEIRLNKVSDVRKGKAITAELTNERWNKRLGYNLPVIKPATAARRLLRIAKKFKFTLFEYYLSDHLGHLRLAKEFERLFIEMDQFLFTLISEFDKKNITLIVCSDHGNLEDLSTKSHTRNPGLTITAGKYAEKIFNEVRDISQIKSSILKYCK
ncbi:MAG: metalloenzyme [Ignavibacteria bacterium]|nr:metalloenzyme [Ignavibacteria bacterium]MBT8382678.1 metalloenzyme [Ignavibacteria bacterium]MBT8391739.1 metalloenzyme [Ignavibacteria bacterium]NNJ51587.1 metalloenzyme [Ignavibacteriaceae bacterium]NNL20325.1 metalloenzyme [Ignavibacteriaceae bacterium]